MKTPVSVDLAGAKVITSGAYSLLDTNFGLLVKFDGVHHVEITVPGEYFDKVSEIKTKLFFSVCITTLSMSSHIRKLKVTNSCYNLVSLASSPGVWHVWKLQPEPL